MSKSKKTKPGVIQRILDKVEVVGNKLPHPVTLFAILMVITLLLSWIFGGVSVDHPGKAAGLPLGIEGPIFYR